MSEIAAFADVSCPFAYVGLTRILAYRSTIEGPVPAVRVRAWPLERVNGAPLSGPALAPKIEALRRAIAPDLFTGFAPEQFPMTSLPALAAEAAAYRDGLQAGNTFSLAVRGALFEEGLDIGDPGVVNAVVARAGSPTPTDEDYAAVERDHLDGVALGVRGSPHFFTPSGDFFCPTLEIHHHEDGYDIEFDEAGFDAFIAAAFG
jgi:2-hydroxychromene-2-carboxylate isomerase